MKGMVEVSVVAYVTRIKDLRRHINADRLMVGSCFSNSVIVGLDVYEGELGIYFPTDSKVGLEFAKENKLIRTKDENGNHLYGYLDEDKRHISTLKLRGEISDGLFMSIDSLSTFTDVSKLKEGDAISVLNGIVICEKYIPRRNRSGENNSGNSGRTKSIEPTSYPLFAEHVDTQQFAYNKHQFKQGDLLYITLKCHGTSARTSRSIEEKKRILPYWLYRTLKFLKLESKPTKTWKYVSGSRRVVLKNFDGGFYGSAEFRKKWHDYFVGKLHKGETIYYEIVAWVNVNQLIMPECQNSKTKDKEFIKQYGNTTRFTYGCEQGQNDIYVYRMTMTNEDGVVFEYSTEQIKARCEQMAVKCVPVLDKFFFTSIEDLEERVDKFSDGPDPIGKVHVREGVCIRKENSNKFEAYKHKNVSFKILEGIIKTSDVLDMEEAESVGEDDE